jgi:hypothetical protein
MGNGGDGVAMMRGDDAGRPRICESKLPRAVKRLIGRASQNHGEGRRRPRLLGQTEKGDYARRGGGFGRRRTCSFGIDGLASDTVVMSNSCETVAVRLFPDLGLGR